jgi:acyl-CoA thioester hydrolase
MTGADTLKQQVDELLKGYPVVLEVPVAWGEMDAFQHVNNVVYFRYFENARIVYSERAGLHKFKVQTGIGSILGSTSCRYKFPLTCPDTVSVGAKTVHLAEDRFTMQYVVVSHRHDKITAEGDGVIVIYDYRENKKTAMTDEMRRRLTALEKA